MSPDTLTTLVFDWGNTLMRVFPDQSGPMCDWTQIATMDYAHNMLSSVQGRFQLILATNASDSDAAQVYQAFERVGLHKYGLRIFTSHELGARKPDLHFFQTLQDILKENPQNIVMIGDDYATDILGAARAGWKTIWFNPTFQSAAGHLSLCNQEIYSLDELPIQLEKFTALPDLPTCLNWMQQYNASLGLTQHVILVAAIAYQLALWLRANGESVSPLLAHRGGLLHDLTKLAKIVSPEKLDHGSTAAQILSQNGLPELAEIALRHPLFCLSDPQRQPCTWEQKLVYFADKLSEGASLVSINHRLNDLALRYPLDSQKIKQITPAVFELQAAICKVLGWQTEQLPNRLREALYQK